jgi:hypothetical protein
VIGSARAWAAMVREVGEAFLGVVRAEIAALAADLQASRRKLTRALVLLAVAAAVIFWSIAVAVDLAVELVALALPRWGALLLVLALLATLALALATAARSRLREIETPAETLRRRMEESRRWWQSRIEAEVDEDEPDLDRGEEGET